MMLNKSQTELGNALGLTFQQVQKYEKGTNRISASRLVQIGNFLQVPVTFFLDDAPDVAPVPGSQDGIAAFMATREGLTLAKSFMRNSTR
jgi:transcriptional regulator with XRE-family HTH domain